MTTDGKPGNERLTAGVQLASRYRLEELAGAGGMATVWRARDERLGRLVAIKVMSDSLAADAAWVARFGREARAHAKITHPNLVRVFDYDVAAAQPYMVMEYVAGATLSQRLDERRLQGREVTELTRELLSAVACVHDHGVLHRDIKPANVLLDTDGRARLTDFGLAHMEGMPRLTRPGEVVGTLRFLAPELIEGGAPSRQSDLYALGVLLRTAADGIEHDPALRELIGWLTRQDPNARPRDAHAALRTLAPARPLTRPARKRSPPPPEPTLLMPVRTGRGPRWRRRATAAGALVLAAVSVGVVVVGNASGGGRSGLQTTPVRSTPARATVASHATQPTLASELSLLADEVRRAAGR